MRAELNLASRPFKRMRLFWLLAGASGAFLVFAAGALLAVYFQKREMPPELVAREQRLDARLRALNEEENRLRTMLQDPANSIVLERSLFLNQLLRRKGISWTRTFADLEVVLPPRVQVMQIRPEVTLESMVHLDMQVGAETPADFIEFLKALEQSDIFEAPDLRGSSPPSENQPLFRYQLSVSYDQQL